MPASHERVPNRPLSGPELVKIVEKDVHDLLSKDGMFSRNIAFSRVSYEVRVSLHLDNPVYPEHVAEVLSRTPSKQAVAKGDGSVEVSPLAGSTTDEEIVFSQERHREIASPNMARVEADLPLMVEYKNLDTGQIEQREQKFKGESPDPLSVKNLTKDTDTTEAQRTKWKKPRKAGKK